MSKKIVQGEEMTVLVDGKAAMHATSHTLNVTLDTKEVQTKDTDGKEIAPGVITFDVQGENLVVIDPSLTEKYGSDDMLDLMLSKKEITILTKASIADGLKQYTGKGYITSFSRQTPVGENASYSYTITGSGELKPYTPPVVEASF